MCGIVGIVGFSPANQQIYDALTVLQHRGQDAAGIMTAHEGALYMRKGIKLFPFMTGGTHERKRRAGTENVPGIAGLGVAARLASGRLATTAEPTYIAIRHTESPPSLSQYLTPG